MQSYICLLSPFFFYFFCFLSKFKHISLVNAFWISNVFFKMIHIHIYVCVYGLHICEYSLYIFLLCIYTYIVCVYYIYTQYIVCIYIYIHTYCI